jgi:LysM repeat protein
MLSRSSIATVIFLVAGLSAYTQHKISVDDYILTYKDVAIEKMKDHGIPASITLAQGILESGSGNSTLARRANNHFGIKCHKGWKGKTFHMDDDARDECFRKYKDPEESYRDHSLFLTTRDRYAGLFKLKTDDYKGWAHGLKKAGYATNPRYPQLLIKIIEENRLYEFDRGITPKYLAEKPANAEASGMQAATIARYPASSAFELVEIWETGRKVYINNGVKFIYARPGDTFSEIAADFGIYSWQLPKYNELDKKAVLEEGQMVYIEKKRRKNKENGSHTVKPGESMHYIAQIYGIRLKQLYRKNKMQEGMEPQVGEVLSLD